MITIKINDLFPFHRSDTWDHWLSIETARSKLFWAPARTSTDPDDADRLVLASNISPFLISSPSDRPPQSLMFRHIVNFLIMLQEDWSPRTHVFEALIYPVGMTQAGSLFKEIHYWERNLALYVSGGTLSKSGVQVKFPTAFRIQDSTTPNFYEVIEDANVDNNPLLVQNADKYKNIVRNIVSQGIDKLSELRFKSILAQMYIRWEQKNSFDGQVDKKGMKFVKNLCKKEPLRNDTDLYKELAILHVFQDNLKQGRDLATKTINSAVSNSENSSELSEENVDSKSKLVSIYRVLAEMWICEDEKKSLRILYCMVSGFSTVDNDLSQELSPTEILKAKKGFEDGLELGMKKFKGDKKFFEGMGHENNFLIEWTTCFALFEFLRGPNRKDFSSASKIFETVLEAYPVKQGLGRSTNYDGKLLRLVFFFG